MINPLFFIKSILKTKTTTEVNILTKISINIYLLNIANNLNLNE